LTVYETIKNRRTIRKFSQKPLSDEMLIKYIDAARLAPSAANKQPLKYKIANSKELVEEILKNVKWASYIAPEGNPEKGEEPTAFIAVLADMKIRETGYEADMGAAVENIILTACEDGVGACWMGAINYNEIKKILKLPENLKLLCVIALGYKGESPKECPIENGNIEYFKDSTGTLNIPKRSLDDIIIK